MALHLASQQGHLEVVRLLLQKGARIEAEDKVSDIIAVCGGYALLTVLLSSFSWGIAVSGSRNGTRLCIMHLSMDTQRWCGCCCRRGGSLRLRMR
jgi:hypothetical protein